MYQKMGEVRRTFLAKQSVHRLGGLTKQICAMQVTPHGKKINKGGAEMEKQEEKFCTRCTLSNRQWGIIRVSKKSYRHLIA